MSHTVLDHPNERAFVFANRDKAKEKANGIKMMIDNPDKVEIVRGEYKTYADYEDDTNDEGEAVNPEVVDHSPSTDGGQAQAKEPEVVETDGEELDPAMLAKDPIDWLEGKNTDFVNYIKGTPAISKQGFRYIQQQFGITTETEVVHTFDDPKGVVVWARAERPDGQFAEAHGEGYIDESGVDANEFVRYGDTRAKNRAISDLTSAGALAVSELSGNADQ